MVWIAINNRDPNICKNAPGLVGMLYRPPPARPPPPPPARPPPPPPPSSPPEWPGHEQPFPFSSRSANQLRIHDTSHPQAAARAGGAEARSRFDASGWSDQPDAMLELEPLVGNRAWMLGLCLIANWRLGNRPIRQGNHTVF
jgi:hypothetical protein